MSADNGIYILKNPVNKNGVFTGENEYRVAMCLAIDNLEKTPYTFVSSDGTKHCVWSLYEVVMFGRSKVFTSKHEAMAIASDIEDKILAAGNYTEYGIRAIVRDHPFPELQHDKAKNVLEEYYESLYSA